MLTALLLLLAATGCDNFDNDKLTEERAMHVFGTKGAPKEPPEDTALCSPGTSKSCDCPNGSQGIQTCLDDGQYWGVCKPCKITPPEDTYSPPEDTYSPPEDTYSPPEEDVPVEPTGACTNEADGALLATEELRDAVTASATDCGIGCLGDDDVGACSVACLVNATGLSVGCSACYAGMVGCTKDNCLAECLADPGSEACINCQVDNNCYTDFYACSGLGPSS